MFRRKINLALLMIVALWLSACALTEQIMVKRGATRLDAAQAIAHIAGNTEKWSKKGGGYYNPNGTIEIIWNGDRFSGPYTVADDGKVCYKAGNWKKECHFYMNDNGTVRMIHHGIASVHEMMQGNKLSELFPPVAPSQFQLQQRRR